MLRSAFNHRVTRTQRKNSRFSVSVVTFYFMHTKKPENHGLSGLQIFIRSRRIP